MNQIGITDLFANPMAGLDPSLILWQAVFASFLATLLGLVITYTYKHTHRGGGYSQNFGQVLIVMSIVVALVMIIIGSNIARAFSLVGALSIIRYRTAVKDARDTMFVFFAMMMGMACGVGLRAVAVYSTLFVCLLIYFLYRSNFGTFLSRQCLLKVRVPAGQDFETTITPYLDECSENLTLTQTETVRQGTALQLTYRLTPKEGFSIPKMLEELQKRTGNEKVTFFPLGDSTSES